MFNDLDGNGEWLDVNGNGIADLGNLGESGYDYYELPDGDNYNDVSHAWIIQCQPRPQLQKALCSSLYGVRRCSMAENPTKVYNSNAESIYGVATAGQWPASPRSKVACPAHQKKKTPARLVRFRLAAGRQRTKNRLSARRCTCA